MATLFNNTEITNAFFNGTELDKIYFNGVLVFEKGGKYKRRIMVGDNLKGKTLYFDGLTKDEVLFINDLIWAENTTLIISTNNDDTGITLLTRDNYPELGMYPGLYIFVSNGSWIYEYDIYNDNLDTYLDTSIINNNNDHIVSDILYKYASYAAGEGYIDDNGLLYRKFYIEDENIRPLKVGDKIIGDTKLYFNFPDNFRDELPQYSLKILDIIFLNENNSDTTRKLNLTYVTNNITKCKVSYYKEASGGAGWNSNENATIFDLEKKRNLSFILAKDMNVLESVGFTGIVSTINESSPAYKYILVDITTLG